MKGMPRENREEQINKPCIDIKDTAYFWGNASYTGIVAWVNGSKLWKIKLSKGGGQDVWALYF